MERLKRQDTKHFALEEVQNVFMKSIQIDENLNGIINIKELNDYLDKELNYKLKPGQIENILKDIGPCPIDLQTTLFETSFKNYLADLSF